MPGDVQELGVDMMCGGSVRWLGGGPGAAYLYVRPDLRERLGPLITGWAAHAAPFEFETGPQRYTDGAERMLHGTPAVPALLQERIPVRGQDRPHGLADLVEHPETREQDECAALRFLYEPLDPGHECVHIFPVIG